MKAPPASGKRLLYNEFIQRIGNKYSFDIHVVQPEIQFPTLRILQCEAMFDVEVGMSVRVDDAKVTGLEYYTTSQHRNSWLNVKSKLTSILNLDVEKNEMPKFDGVNRHDPSRPKVALPVLVSVLVVDPILEIVGEEVLKFDGCTESEINLGIFPM